MKSNRNRVVFIPFSTDCGSAASGHAAGRIVPGRKIEVIQVTVTVIKTDEVRK